MRLQCQASESESPRPRKKVRIVERWILSTTDGCELLMGLMSSDYMKTLEIDRRAVLERELDRVVDDAIRSAIANPGRGILVTRRSPGTFTVELSNVVPQGTIAELDLTKPAPPI
jgi:hypothetical protein